MKKIYKVIICLSMLLSVIACGKENDSPSAVTGYFLKAYADKNEELIRTYSVWKDYNVKALEIQQSDYIDGVDKQLQKQVFEMMQSFRHKEGKETIRDNNASVKVTLSMYNFDPVVKTGLSEATKKAEELSKQGTISDVQAQAEINTILFQHMKNAKETKKESITINLIKKGGKWLVSNDNADIQNILISNMKSLQDIGA